MTPEDERPKEHDALDDLVDEASMESFPASDPPSFWAGPPDPPPKRPRRGSEAVVPPGS